MAVIKLDSWDHYDVQTDKWDSAGSDCAIRLNTGQSRTGIGCLEINTGAVGPDLTLAANYTDILAATAWYSSLLGNVVWFENFSWDIGLSAAIFGVKCQADRSLSIIQQPNGGGHNATLGSSAAGVVTFNTYNGIAFRVTFIAGNKANMFVWCNGSLVLTLLNVNTAVIPSAGLQFINGVRLMGPGGSGFSCFHDDFYLLDCSVGPNNAFPGGFPRVFASVPASNAAPVNWTPLAGQNFANVNEIPPDNDTSYVSSATVGQQDQYNYLATGVPVGSQILAAQYNLDARVDSGARSIAASLGAHVSAGVALSAGYHDYTTPFDVNPNTGVAFVGADFPLAIGPQVTA